MESELKETADKLKRELDSIALKTGDVLRLELGNGILSAWEIEGFFYGSVGQESVIQIKSLGIKPATVSTKPFPYNVIEEMFIPANLIHKAIKSGLLTVYKTNNES